MKLRRWPRGVRAGVGVLVALAVAGCGAGAGGQSCEQTKLVVSTYGNFGYKGELEKQYEKAHPNIDVVIREQEFAAHHEQLAQHLAAGSGAADIEAIDTDWIAQFKGQPENFVNLLELGAGEIRNRWLDWKWRQSLAAAGNHQIGLGTDVGGLAMCYRRDLFEKAGLPTDRDEVSDLISSWKGYIEAGKEFEKAGLDAYWMDAPSNLFNAVLRQQKRGYFNRQNELVMATNPGFRKAWSITMSATKADLSADLTAFQAEWVTGFRKSSFATVTCPAWMMGNIKEYSKEHAGDWDIARIPGGSGNWGGSFLTIPKQGENTEEAYKLAKWLTAPQQQLKIFKNVGNMPSTPSLYDDPALTEFQDPFFNDAPVGEIFTSAAKKLEPQYRAPQFGNVRAVVVNVIDRVAQGAISPSQGWNKAIQKAKREVS